MVTINVSPKAPSNIPTVFIRKTSRGGREEKRHHSRVVHETTRSRNGRKKLAEGANHRDTENTEKSEEWPQMNTDEHG
jgi:hypothetical protein